MTGHSAGQKGSDNAAVNDLEANGLGNYNDTILTLIDQLMVCLSLCLVHMFIV